MLKNLSVQAAAPQLSPVLDGKQLLALRDEVDAVRIHDVLLDYALQVVGRTRAHERIQLGVSPAELCLDRGAARLISSASTSWVNNGPGRNSNSPLA